MDWWFYRALNVLINVAIIGIWIVLQGRDLVKYLWWLLTRPFLLVVWAWSGVRNKWFIRTALAVLAWTVLLAYLGR